MIKISLAVAVILACLQVTFVLCDDYSEFFNSEESTTPMDDDIFTTPTLRKSPRFSTARTTTVRTATARTTVQQTTRKFPTRGKLPTTTEFYSQKAASTEALYARRMENRQSQGIFSTTTERAIWERGQVIIIISFSQ